MTTRRSLVLAVLAIAAVAVLLALPSSCSSIPRRDPTGEPFPSVVGTSLDDEEMRIPDDFRGDDVLLLVGYAQDAQFDIDRWLLGLLQAQVAVRTYEVPTIGGMVPRMISGYIDDGMRSGIPSEDWGSVVTVYGDAGEIIALTGDEGPNTARVLLLDEAGKVVWFWDQGYSAGRLMELSRAVAEEQ